MNCVAFPLLLQSPTAASARKLTSCAYLGLVFFPPVTTETLQLYVLF